MTTTSDTAGRRHTTTVRLEDGGDGKAELARHTGQMPAAGEGRSLALYSQRRAGTDRDGLCLDAHEVEL
jgi:hypothetical protein